MFYSFILFENSYTAKRQVIYFAIYRLILKQSTELAELAEKKMCKNF